MKEVFMIFALLTSAPQPADNYKQPISPETATNILENVIDGKFEASQDFDNDGALTIADYTAVKRRHYKNVTEGNTVTLDYDTAHKIAKYYCFESMVNWSYGENPTFTTSEAQQITLHIEFNDYCKNYLLDVDPITETIEVIDASTEMR